MKSIVVNPFKDNRLKKKNNRAISPVFSTLLMVNIALAAGIAYYAWAQNSLSQSYSILQIIYEQDIEQSREDLVVEDARYLNLTKYPTASYELNLTVRNIGKSDLKITTLYMNTTNIIEHVDDPVLVEGYYHLFVEEKVTFKFSTSPIGMNEGDIVNIIVTTQRGTKTIALWEVLP